MIDSGEQLQQVLDTYAGGRIFIIGSGENQRDARREMRGPGISKILTTSDRLEEVYLGNDGKTKVWRARPASGD